MWSGIRGETFIIIINIGGGPTDDKPTVTPETPRDPDRVSSFLNLRVEDIHAKYAEWSARLIRHCLQRNAEAPGHRRRKGITLEATNTGTSAQWQAAMATPGWEPTPTTYAH